jgi:hypothetical protein
VGVRRVVIHIDRLVVRGLDVADVPSFTAALEQELARVVAISSSVGNPRFGIAAQHSRRAQAVLPRVANAERLGACVARGIAGALTP